MSNPADLSPIEYEWIGDLTSHGVMITDTRFEIRWWNRWFTQHTRQPAGAVVGQQLFTLFPELVGRQLDTAYARALDGQTVVLSQRLHRYLLPMPAADEYAGQFSLMQQSAQIAPLVKSGVVVGTITLLHDVTERVAREQDLERLLAQEQAARSDLERSVDKIEQMLAITTELGGALSPAAIAAVILGRGGAVLNAYAGIMAQLGADGSALETIYGQGYPDDAVAAWRVLPLDLATPLTDAVVARQPVFIPSREELLGRYPLLAAAQPMERTRALAALPLIVQERVVGAIGLSFPREQPFGAEDRAFLETLAVQGAMALERARLYEIEQQARARAESAVEIRDQFLSIAAHEFRTPLTSMLGNAQLLQRRIRKAGAFAERDQRLLQVTIDQGVRLSKMVSLLLDISRLETGRFSLSLEPLDLERIVRRLVEEHQTTGTQHAISYAGPGREVLVSGDELRLEQVFHNLLSNAIKYSADGSEVAVLMRLEGDQVTVAVSDQGIGIPDEALPHLFTQFFRAANVEERRIDGVGIGLYVVREIVTRHGGTIEVASAEGRGSSFTVRLPLL